MIVRKLEDLLVHQKARVLWDAVTAILECQGVQQDLRLHAQLRDASDSVAANISEGFEQPTDKAFARYLFTAKASAAEVRTRVAIARRRRYINAGPARRATDLSNEVAKMCVGLAKYLLKCNRRRRGLGKFNAEEQTRRRRVAGRKPDPPTGKPD